MTLMRREGPESLVLVAGQRLWKLPPALANCQSVLVWPWTRTSAADRAPIVVESDFLLWTLNDLLRTSALLVQPLASSADAEARSQPSLLEHVLNGYRHMQYTKFRHFCTGLSPLTAFFAISCLLARCDGDVDDLRSRSIAVRRACKL